MKFKELSIKNFIGDLPRIFNENFNLVRDVLNNIVDNKDPNTAAHSLTATGMKITGKAEVNTLSANNIILLVNNKKISLLDLIQRVEDLEEKINN